MLIVALTIIASQSRVPAERQSRVSSPTPPAAAEKAPSKQSSVTALLLPPPPHAAAPAAKVMQPKASRQVTRTPSRTKPRTKSATKITRPAIKPLRSTTVKKIPVPRPRTVKVPSTITPADTVQIIPALAKGRALLHLLEHGAGPGIEIAWPDGATDRRQLYGELRRCYGMVVAVRDRQGRLYRVDDPPGRAWRPNIDRYSGFLRQPTGAMTRAERRDVHAILHQHGLRGGHSPVRIFPRRVDALLLAGLKNAVGTRYHADVRIGAQYQLNGRRLRVGAIRVDGRATSGRIELSRARRGRC